MSTGESDATAWEREADAITCRAAMDAPLVAAREDRFDRETTAAAVPLRVHQQTWKLALDGLVQHGREQRYVGSGGGGPYRHAFSTGMLAVREPEDMPGGGTLVTALRLSLRDGRIDSKGLRAVNQARRSGVADDWDEAHNKLHNMVQESGLWAEVYMAATHKELLPGHELSFNSREVAYPQTRKQRWLHNFHDETSLNVASAALRAPEVPQVRAEPFHVLGRYLNINVGCAALLSRPAIFMPDCLSNGRGESYSLEAAMENAQQYQQAISTLGDMLLKVTRPLREIPAFQPHHE